MEMNSTSDVLRCMKGELAWALEGSAAEWGEPYVLWSVVPDWRELSTITYESRDSIAVCAECEVVFEDTLDQVEQADRLQTLDPRHLAFRHIGRNPGERKSLMLILKDQVPAGRDLFALPFMVRCDRDVVHLRARTAGITFAGWRATLEETRRKSEQD